MFEVSCILFAKADMCKVKAQISFPCGSFSSLIYFYSSGLSGIHSIARISYGVKVRYAIKIVLKIVDSATIA